MEDSPNAPLVLVSVRWTSEPVIMLTRILCRPSPLERKNKFSLHFVLVMFFKIHFLLFLHCWSLIYSIIYTTKVCWLLLICMFNDFIFVKWQDVQHFALCLYIYAAQYHTVDDKMRERTEGIDDCMLLLNQLCFQLICRYKSWQYRPADDELQQTWCFYKELPMLK